MEMPPRNSGDRLSTICFTVPERHQRPFATQRAINKDAKILLKFFVPAGTKATSFSLARVARTLCIAFKGMPADEVYNVLVTCLIRALQKYDPTYTEKVQTVVAAIDVETEKKTHFTTHQVSTRVGFQAQRICKMLVKRGNLEQVDNPNNPTGQLPDSRLHSAGRPAR
jgi:hypothetical protein